MAPSKSGDTHYPPGSVCTWWGEESHYGKNLLGTVVIVDFIDVWGFGTTEQGPALPYRERLVTLY